ncbi:reverse gyrase [Thermosulfurimonas sp. F29]|uniref:reverse gyrase n=1 Tax=Thermosulfurimonas sp. F29 TaxID=2867247 RepID=UPI001C83C129|nr:reverse gyrase [Thermosulfurimonas sp. F29]MBX6423823.1 reverse gyrase [Thermosulfurimonas sp. F29]
MLFSLAHGCPNCGGEIGDDRLLAGWPCERCLPEPEEPCALPEERLLGLRPFCEAREKLAHFREMFIRAVGHAPSSLQETWAKRFFLGESFAIVAPTGSGKTTFGLLLTLLNPGKSLIVVPTRLLCDQLHGRLEALAERLSISRKILAYRGRRRDKEAFAAGDYEILVATSAFMYQHGPELARIAFSLVFVDDVDAFLKRSRHLETLFRVLGFTEEEILLALKPRKTDHDFELLNGIRERGGRARLIISSATLKPRTSRVVLFQQLLGFDIQRATSTLRNVLDAYLEVPRDKLFSEAVEVCRRLGAGGLIFLSEDLGKAEVPRFTEFLRRNGIRAVSYLEASPEKLVEGLQRGDFEVAVGLAHLGNPLVRGLDLPEVLRYAVFVGVPKHVFSLRLELSPQNLYALLSALLPVFEGEEETEATAHLRYLRNYLTLRAEDLPRYPRIEARLREIRHFLETRLSESAFRERLRSSEEVFLEEREGELFVVVGDAAAYLQASGRVSRLSARGVLPGLSVVLAESRRALASLKHRLRFFLGEPPDFRPLPELNLEEVSRRLTEARRGLREGRTPKVRSTLLVVESPHKARTIASFWGRPSHRRLGRVVVYEIPTEDRLLMVTASLGHVFNLSRRRGLFGVFSEDGRYRPLFDTIKRCQDTGEELVDPEEVKERCPGGRVWDKGEILAALARVAFSADEVLIGSDPDAEGEKIAYDLMISLRPYQANIRRLEFHEVTPRALREALARPQDFNTARVKAQLARRVADRWVGFALSRYLWRVFSRRGLSAGRVQTPVLGWVIERAREAGRKRYLLSFRLGGRRFTLELEDGRRARSLKEEFGTLRWEVLEESEEEIPAPSPFTTDTVLEEAHTRLGFTSRYTMTLLQHLFESGLITYHRTDSTRVSEAGRFQVARPYLEKTLGADFFFPRAWGEGGAHEAIRPTRPWDLRELRSRVAHGLLSLENERDALRLYDLIFRRFMASQCRNPRVKVARLRFTVSDFSWEDRAPVEMLRPGHDRLWEPLTLFQPRGGPEEIRLRSVSAKPLFTEGTLVQEMKKRGLGRPSTYAEIVSTLLSRGYVKAIKGGRLVPTHLGKEVYEVLRRDFPHLVSEEFTRELETLMDRIEEGQDDWQEVCRKLEDLVRRFVG